MMKQHFKTDMHRCCPPPGHRPRSSWSGLAAETLSTELTLATWWPKNSYFKSCTLGNIRLT